MRTYRATIIVTILLLGVLAAGMLLGVISGTDAAETHCTDCHADKLEGKYVHPVVGQCDTCHQPTGKEHPDPGTKTFRLTEEPGPLCTSCHPDKTGMNIMHSPTAAGDCVSCHSPHSSAFKGMVLKEGPGLCTGCHADIGAEMNKKVVHPAIMNGCTSCHNPHGSSNRNLLPEEGASLCFQCHPDIQTTINKAKSVHPPIKTSKACLSCHAPHASEYTKLLVKSYPEDVYAAYTDKEYDLCFSCHNRDLVRFPDRSSATNFRNGDRNLHYVHVNKSEKGRSCTSCHTPHGGTLPKLIADKVKFGKWDLPVAFVKTDTGGSCIPGCHKRLSYDRSASGPTPEQPPAPDKGKK